MAPSTKKCMKPGIVTRNPYFNFLREFRKSNCGLSAVEIVKRGAQKWRTMSPQDRCQFIAMAHTAPKMKRRSRLGGRRSQMRGRRGGRVLGRSRTRVGRTRKSIRRRR